MPALVPAWQWTRDRSTIDVIPRSAPDQEHENSVTDAPLLARPMLDQCSSSSILTLADVLNALSDTHNLTLRQRQDAESAVRKIARLLACDPARLPANRRALRRRLAGIAPAAHGIDKPTWSKTLSQLNAALDSVLPEGARRTRDLTLTPEYQQLQKRIACQWTRRALSRFFQCCGQAEIAPSAVDETAMEHFAVYLDATLLKHPTALMREARTAWNRACRDVPYWPGQPLPVKPQPNAYSLPWNAFPASLREDLQGWLDRLSSTDLLSFLLETDDAKQTVAPPRSVRPTTLKFREYQVRQFASALVQSGVDPASLKILADLVRPEMMKVGLRFYLGRHAQKANPALPGLVGGLLSIARHWAQAGPEDLAWISNCLRRIRKQLPGRGMTEKNRNRLRPFEDRENALTLLRLPGRLFDLAGETQHPHRAALLVQHALAIEILLMALLRISNLAALDIERHLIPINRSRGTMHLVIPGNEVKNSYNLRYPLPQACAALLRRYREDFRPVLAEPGSTALFPGQLGKAKNSQAFGRQISKIVFEHTQLRMNPHLFRHTMAKLYLTLHPEQRETVRLALGHRSLATSDYYVDTNNAAALRHFNQAILGLRGAAKW